jgi:hypothetical protein
MLWRIGCSVQPMASAVPPAAGIAPMTGGRPTGVLSDSGVPLRPASMPRQSYGPSTTGEEVGRDDRRAVTVEIRGGSVTVTQADERVERHDSPRAGRGRAFRSSRGGTGPTSVDRHQTGGAGPSLSESASAHLHGAQFGDAGLTTFGLPISCS